MLFADAPVRPAAESFLSTAHGTHGWENVPCFAGGLAVAGVRSAWVDQPVSVDIESYGLDRYSARLKCVSFASPSTAFVLDPRDDVQRQAIGFVIHRAPKLIFHNAAFDVPNLARNGLIGPEHCAKIEDTLVHARLAEPDSLTSKSLIMTGHRYLGTPKDDHLLTAFKLAGLPKEQGYFQFDIDRYVYLLGAGSDALITSRLLDRVRTAAYDRLTTGHPFTENGVTGGEAWALVEKLQRFNRVLLRRACRGMRVDAEFLDRYQERTAAELSAAEKGLAELHIRPGNAGDLMTYLDRHDAIPPGYPRTAKTKKPSTVADHLESLNHPVAQLYVTHKQISKVQNDYLAKAVDQSGDDGRIYPAVNVLAAVTGRTSVSGTPYHQFPEPARGIILADEGDALTSMDWSQIEPTVITNIAAGRGSEPDRLVLEAFEAGADFYQPIMDNAGINRPTAKVVLLAQLYGEGVKKLAADLGIPKDGEVAEELYGPDWDGTTAVDLRDSILSTLPGVADLVRAKSACVLPSHREGLLRRIGRDFGVIFTLAGRIVPVPMGRGWLDEETGEVGPPSRAVHKSVNFHVQGSAFDVLMEAVLAGDDAGLSDTLYITMHDELVTSTAAADEWEKIMRTPPERLCHLAKRVPLLRTDRVDIGERWAKV
jgi:DNA polymerase I-like protein with 3'-5' exonuclease and polymerase domains